MKPQAKEALTKATNDVLDCLRRYEDRTLHQASDGTVRQALNELRSLSEELAIMVRMVVADEPSSPATFHE